MDTQSKKMISTLQQSSPVDRFSEVSHEPLATAEAPSCTGNHGYYESMSVMAMAHPEDRVHSIPARLLILTFCPLLCHDVP